ncbi:transposase [Streptomyces sp. NPDC059629]|uniref:transposase n=1 Tax=Streptomyces sp. NPDC059629 TaxID=3346889 RepID=UPI003687BF7E
MPSRDRPDKSYLDARWNQARTNAWKAWGDRATRLQRQLPASSHLLPHQSASRPNRAPLPRPHPAPSPAEACATHPDSLSEVEQLRLKAVLAHRPELEEALTGHVRTFAHILTDRRSHRLPEWLDAVRQVALPGLHTAAVGIDRDRVAVIAGLTLPWNSGIVEGHVNRIKMLERQMFGRPGFALLRKQVLLAPVADANT